MSAAFGGGSESSAGNTNSSSSTQSASGNESYGYSGGQSQGSTLGYSQGDSYGASQGSNYGMSQGMSSGASQGTNYGESLGSSYGGSQGASYGTTQGTALGQSQSQSDVWGAQQPALQQLYQQAAMLANGQSAGGMGAQQVANQAQGAWLGQLTPGGNPYFERSVQSAIDSATRGFTDNVLPELDARGVAVGQYGGARDSLARGQAAGTFGEGLANQVAGMYSNQYAGDQQRAQAALGQAGQIQGLYSQPLSTAAGIIGGPTVLTQQQAYNQAQNTGVSQANNTAYNQAQNSAYNTGQNTAYSNAQNSAYNTGQNTAYNQAQNTAYNSGQNTASNFGENTGTGWANLISQALSSGSQAGDAWNANTKGGYEK